ncbi:hypothetical protein [Bradyrhizobium sp.]|jgi:hypothetical protein|nr:hypothetical protein [Bradyrhizobium sp.]HWX59885.1 hypothetical protein [Bradyrhizobium sp.]
MSRSDVAYCGGGGGLIWVYGPGDDETMAFTDFGIETLTGTIEIYA